jgi:hypothetical protein
MAQLLELPSCCVVCCWVGEKDLSLGLLTPTVRFPSGQGLKVLKQIQCAKFPQFSFSVELSALVASSTVQLTQEIPLKLDICHPWVHKLGDL